MKRREFTTLLAATGDGIVMDMSCISSNSFVPTRPFGKSGKRISILGLGGFFDSLNDQSLLQDALDNGINYWEITGKIGGQGYGKYFREHPQKRDMVFLMAKTGSTNPDAMSRDLEKVLQEANTAWVDFFAIQPVDNIKILNQDVQKWAENTKRKGLIHNFGICTHREMEANLEGACDLGWIDGIVTIYNYRLREIQRMQDALQKCHEKGIGIIAIKSMGLGVLNEQDMVGSVKYNKMKEELTTSTGLTFEQLKLRAIWDNENVTTVCSLMPSKEIMKSNISAALYRKRLNPEAECTIKSFIIDTQQHYCRCCGDICDLKNKDGIPIFGLMRLLLYARGYGEVDFAAEFYKKIPETIRNKIAGSDYSESEKACPQRMQIRSLMIEAVTALGR